MENQNQLAKIVEEYDLPENRATILLEKFGNFFEMAADWDKKVSALNAECPSIADSAMAASARKFLKSKRNEIEKTRKELKETPLREGQSIDAIAKILTNLILPIEKRSEDIEKFQEIQEQKRKLELAEKRQNEIFPFAEYIPQNLNFGEMNENEYNNLLSGAKLQKAAKEQAEKQAEADRLAKIEAERAENERIRHENERLKKENEEKELAAKEEKKQREKIEAELKTKADEELKKQKERERIEIERIEAEKKAANAPDKQKLLILADIFFNVKLPDVKSNDTKVIIENIALLQSKLVNFIREKANTL